MAITFDGINLLITLESGVTEVDIVNDLYRDWKDYMLASPLNRRFPHAFVSDGGAPLTAIINQGSYIFLNNVAGWRIKPPEEDITIFLIGNLAAGDVEVETIVPTTGEFTAALIGLQPITQGVIPSMRDNLEFTTFQNVVNLDIINGTIPAVTPAYIGPDRVGTRRAPCGDLTTALNVAVGEGITILNIIGDYDSTPDESTDFSTGYQFTADSPTNIFTIDPDLNLLNCSFNNMTLSGSVDGVNKIENCHCNGVTNFSGVIYQSDVEGDISLVGTAISGQAAILSCYSAIAALNYPRITNCGDQEIVVRDFRGSLGIADMTGGSHSIGIYGGRLIIEASCSGGTIYVRGDPYEITDLASGAVTIIDQTSSFKTSEIHGGVVRDVWLDTSLGVNGNGYQQSPYNNLTDAIDYAEENGITSLVFLDDVTLDRNLKNMSVRGVGVPTVDLAGFDLKGSEFHRVRIQGTYIDTIIVQESVLLTGMFLNGFFENCSLNGDLTCVAGGNVYMKGCASNIPGLGRPTISMNAAGAGVKLSIRDHGGGLTIKDTTHVDDEVTVEIARGSLTFDASNTLGAMVARTDGKFVDATAGATVTKEAYSQDIWESMDLDTLPNDKIADMVFKKPAADFTDPSTIGGFIIKKILTVGKFLGLK